MPRIARVVAPGFPHHVTQRGNNKQKLFLNDSDRKNYLFWMNECSQKYGLKILAYCLMDNHVHFIVVPSKEDSLARTFSTVHMKYAQYFHKNNQTSGHLWQGRFFSCVLDEVHLDCALRYVENNPVRANYVKKPWLWKWSSTSEHIGIGKSILALENIREYINFGKENWKTFIDNAEDEKIFDNIRKNSLTGRPLGTSSFIEKLGKEFNCNLSVPKMGRPSKNK